MADTHSHKWLPIADLPADWVRLADSELANFVRAWQDEAHDLESRAVYQEFLNRLRREWAIETGVLEQLYSLSEGASRTLIEKGLDAAFIGREDTDRPPNLVAAMIKDQYRAIEGLYQFVSNQRQLSTSYIKELHQVLTANQEFCDAVD